MTDTQAKNIYFLGIGGIGMSAIARYYLLEGVRVGGYDRTETALTRALASEGADIHYEDDPARIAAPFRNPDDTLVVYTPAIPHDHAETAWFRSRGFRMLKRSEILGVLAADKYVMAVAGTHGKTTTTTLTAWLNHVAGGGGSAFLGGISKNFDSNFVHGPGRRLAVEADEFDRSFLQLWPDAAVITSADADHLDIYGTHEELRRTFARFAGQIKPGGTLIIKQGVELPIANRDIRTYTYTCDAEADFHATGLEVQPDGTYRFDIVCPDRTIPDCRLGIPGRVNVENAVAAVALLWVAGFDEAKLREGLETFRGVKRRFAFHINTPELIYMDDYAHHPGELHALLEMAKTLPYKRIICAFQPHTYTRTKALFNDFVKELRVPDVVVLAEIYAAREQNDIGISSQDLAREIPGAIYCSSLEKVTDTLASLAQPGDLILTVGAGDIFRAGEKLLERA